MDVCCFYGSTLLPTLLKSRSLHDVLWSFKTAPVLDWSVFSLVWPVFVYLGLYSFLPHKELRFIFNAIPILNMVSAVVGCATIRGSYIHWTDWFTM